MYSLVSRAVVAQSVERLATGWTTEGSEFECREGQEFSLCHIVQTSSGAHPDSSPVGTGALSLAVKWPGREAYHSPQTSAEVKKTWICVSPNFFTSLHFIVFHRCNPKGRGLETR
jgi:hypothetical protein